jgi:predicted ATPase
VKTINLSNDIPTLIELLKLARKESLILKTDTGEEFVISQIDDFDYELARQRQNQELMAFLDERFQEKGVYTLEEVEQMLGLNDEEDD